MIIRTTTLWVKKCNAMNVKFSVKLKKMQKRLHDMLCQVYGNNSWRKNVFINSTDASVTVGTDDVQHNVYDEHTSFLYPKYVRSLYSMSEVSNNRRTL